MGRRAKLKQPISIEEAVSRVKKHLNLPHVRVAKPPGIHFNNIHIFEASL